LFIHKKPTILFKVDISKAFDSIAWSFLLELLGHLGFGGAHLNWITELLGKHQSHAKRCTRTHNCHVRGLRQGDLLSPMLFILVMDVLNALFRKAEEWSLLQQLGVPGITHRVSLYANNVIVFLSPAAAGLELASIIFMVFQGASGLTCNKMTNSTHPV
jgi:hypothetical protein